MKNFESLIKRIEEAKSASTALRSSDSRTYSDCMPSALHIYKLLDSIRMDIDVFVKNKTDC